MNLIKFSCILSIYFVFSCVYAHHLSHHKKIELAKKVGAMLFFATKKKMMLPLPLPLPVPIPIFKQYQPIIHDPYFFKHQIIMQKLGAIGKLGHLGGAIGGLGGGLGGFGGLGGMGFG